MVKMNLSDVNVPELIADMWEPLNEEQREFLANHFTLQNYKKNEVIHCEGETPKYLMCLLNGKVKIYKDGVGGRSQIIRMIKPVEYFGYRAYFAKEDYVTAAAAFEPSLICLIPMSAITTLVIQADQRRFESGGSSDIVFFGEISTVTEILDGFNHADNLASATDTILINLDFSI